MLRNVLDGCDDAFVLRAAEMFFRPQRLTVHEGSLVAADEETVSGLGDKPVSPLVSMLGLPAAAEIDVLNEDNAGELLAAQRPVRHGARPDRGPARPGRARRGDASAGSPTSRRRG